MMFTATEFLDELQEAGITFVSGTPCSYLKPLINAVGEDPRFRFRDAVNEGDAVAMAAGAVLGGLGAAVMFQNSGLGNAVNALTSLCRPFRVPLLIVVTHRGEPGGQPDEPQHELMGEITTKLLDTLQVPWRRFPSDREEARRVLQTLTGTMVATGSPVALVMRQDDLAPHHRLEKRQTDPIGERRVEFLERLPLRQQAWSSRTTALRVITEARRPAEVLVATTGYTGRELFALGDEPWNLYLAGAMGSASAMGLGLALVQPDRPVTVIDGDGALLMRLGNLAMVGAAAPAAFTHVVLDNEVHDSTGGQPTVSRGVAFGAIARACGYTNVMSTDEPEAFATALRGRRDDGPWLMHVRIAPGAPRTLPRPNVSPAAVFRRLQGWLGVEPLAPSTRERV